MTEGSVPTANSRSQSRRAELQEYRGTIRNILYMECSEESTPLASMSGSQGLLYKTK